MQNRYKNIAPLTLAVISLLLGFFSPFPSHAAVDNSIYADLLGRFVRDGRVNYRGFKSEQNRLDEYLNVLERIDPGSLPRQEQFAFYINVYNAWTIKLVLDGYPGVESIKNLGSFFKSPWKKNIVRLHDGLYTLNNIEHDILRPRFTDPRVHFAINCASLSCPPLQPEPYSGKKLDVQLDSAARSFINDSEMNFLKGDTLNVSKIFKWFPEDFNNDVTGFFLQYADTTLQQGIRSAGERIKVRYLDYDWSLNGE